MYNLINLNTQGVTKMLKLAQGGVTAKDAAYFEAIMGINKARKAQEKQQWALDCATADNNPDERQFVLSPDLDTDWTIDNLTALRQMKHGLTHVLDYGRFFIIYANGCYQIFAADDAEPPVTTNHALFALLIADFLAAS